ncbi:hypothetical protein D3C86_2111820 [compost metagenome]
MRMPLDDGERCLKLMRGIGDKAPLLVKGDTKLMQEPIEGCSQFIEFIPRGRQLQPPG